MQLRELNGNLKAYKASNDVIHDLDDFSEFHISERVANELKQDPDFLAENHWYLATAYCKETATIRWDIIVNRSDYEIPIEGTVEFEDGFPVLA